MRRNVLIGSGLAVTVALSLVILVVAFHKKPVTTASNTSASGKAITFVLPRKTAPAATSSGSSTAAVIAPIPDQQVLAAAIAEAASDSDIADGSFTITATSQPAAGWYIVNLQPANDGEPAIAVLQQVSGSPSLVIGPGTAFPQSALDNAGVPQAVSDQLPVYNDGDE